LTTITNKATGMVTPITQDFYYYKAVQNSEQNSGAYIFRPTDLDPVLACNSQPQVQVVSGPVVSEVRTVCGWLAQTVRLVNNEGFAEFEFQTDSIPMSDNVGKEVITRFTTNIRSNSVWFTDSNGREFQTRKRNYRPTWNLTVTEPVAGNYYPINAAAFLRDSATQLSVLNDRSQGVSSMNDGELEIMIHRRLLQDDGRGVGEPLNETDGIRPYPNPDRIGTGLHITGSHYVIVDVPANSLQYVRKLQSRVFAPYVLGFTPLKTSVNQWVSSHATTQSFLQADLPVNVELMTLQPVTGGTILRLAHAFGVGEDSKLSNPVTVDLSALFSNVTINVIEEVSLTTNQHVNQMRPLNWNIENDAKASIPFAVVPFDGETVTINPMDVRTFLFTTK